MNSKILRLPPIAAGVLVIRHIANPIIQRNIENHFKLLDLSLPIICTPEVLLGAKIYD